MTSCSRSFRARRAAASCCSTKPTRRSRLFHAGCSPSVHWPAAHRVRTRKSRQQHRAEFGLTGGPKSRHHIAICHDKARVASLKACWPATSCCCSTARPASPQSRTAPVKWIVADMRQVGPARRARQPPRPAQAPPRQLLRHFPCTHREHPRCIGPPPHRALTCGRSCVSRSAVNRIVGDGASSCARIACSRPGSSSVPSSHLHAAS
ncbi:hypothetical protein RLIN73S_04992 [Rhodanobacter lindaniclasticus]